MRTNRTFVRVGMTGIIKSRTNSPFQPPSFEATTTGTSAQLSVITYHGESSAVVSESLLIPLQSEIPALTAGALSLIGGVVGFARKRSVPSLIGGVGCVVYLVSTTKYF